MKADILPNNVLEKMSEADRRSLGRAGRSITECQADNSIKLERELHKLIWNELTRREIVFVHSRMDKKSSIGVGLPDFMFAINGHPVAMEVKLYGNTLTAEQEAVRAQMVANGWDYRVVFSFDEAAEIIAVRSLTV